GSRRGRGHRLLRDRHRLERSALPAPVHRHPDHPSRGPVRPARRRGDRHVRDPRPALAFFAVAALAPLVVRDAFLLDGLILILMWGASAAAWNVAGGYAGQLSLGHSAFFGLGAYSAALLGTRWGVSPWIGLLVGAGLATAFGSLLSFPSHPQPGTHVSDASSGALSASPSALTAAGCAPPPPGLPRTRSPRCCSPSPAAGAASPP